MKLDLLSISLFFIITIAVVKAQRYTKFNKPVIDLNSKPQVTTPKLPEERRKLSIFPKSMVKYVVTSIPYSKVRTYSPYPVTTKRPLMQKLVPEEMKNVRTMAATRPPIMNYNNIATTTQFTPKRQFTPRLQFTMKPPIAQIPKETNFYENEEDRYMKSTNNRYNVADSSQNNLSSFDEKDYEDEGESEKADKELGAFSSTRKTENVREETIDLDAVESNESSTINVNKTIELANKEEEEITTVKEQLVHIETESARKENNHNEKEQDKEDAGEEPVITESENEKTQNAETKNDDTDFKELEFEGTESMESENNRKKRLSVLGRGFLNNILVIENKPAKEDSNTASEMNDRNEFIFIKDYLKVPVEISKSSNYVAAEIDDSVEIATEIAWLEEYKPRPERSINIIEEENLGTTVSSFKFTGRSDPRVDSEFVFRNINA